MQKILLPIELKKVSKLGPKAFEQSAGFLRVTDGKEPLDATAVHPESYSAANALLKELGFTSKDISIGKLEGIYEKCENIGFSDMAEKLGYSLNFSRQILQKFSP